MAASLVTRYTLHGEVAEQVQHSMASVGRVALIPAQDVVVLSATVPKASKAKLKQALPYLFEEQLVDEVDHYHICQLAAQDDQVFAAVISHERMQYWQSVVVEQAIDCLVPDACLLPVQPGCWSLQKLDNTLLLKTSAYHYMQLDVSNLATLWPSLLECYGQPVAVDLYGDFSNIDLAIIKSSTYQQQSLDLNGGLQQSASLLREFNLLQGDYAQQSQWLSKTTWQKPLKLLAMAVAIYTGSLMTAYGVLYAKYQTTQQQVQQLIVEVLPGESADVQQLQHLLQQLSHRQHDSEFMNVASQVLPMVAKVDISLKNIDYQNNEMTLTVSGDANVITSLKNNLADQHNVVIKTQQEAVT